MGKTIKGQVGGDHYKKHKIQPWHIIDEYSLGYYVGNVVKYLLRDKGNKLEDCEKAAHFLAREIELLKIAKDKEHTPSLFGTDNDT